MAMIKEEDCPEGLPAWLATFGDLMSLLLTFFVLLLSFSSMNIKSFQHAMGALQGALGVLSGQPELSLPIRQSMPKTEGNLSQAEMMNKAGQELEHAIEEAGLQGDMHLEESTEGIIIRVSDRLFFDSAEATIKQSADKFLSAIGRAIAPLPNHINVQGHTDPRPVNAGKAGGGCGFQTLPIQRSGENPAREGCVEDGVHGCPPLCGSRFQNLIKYSKTLKLSQSRPARIP